MVDDFGRVLTPYSKYPVTFDKTLHDNVKINRWLTADSTRYEKEYAIEKGMFHCFQSLEETKRRAIILYGIFGLDIEQVPNERLIIAQATVPPFTRYYRGIYGHTIAESICAKRIRLSSKDTVTVELPEVPEE